MSKEDIRVEYALLRAEEGTIQDYSEGFNIMNEGINQ